MTVFLREAGVADTKTIADLHVTSWRDAYSQYLDSEFLAGPVQQDRLAVWTERLAQPRAEQRVTLALSDDEPVGFVCTFGDDDATWGARLDNLHVMPGARSTGTGGALLHSAHRWVAGRFPASGMFLWVFEANVMARRFYERHGGKIAQRSVSGIPSAHSAPVLRFYWTASDLAHCIRE